jgi:uncharacterized protein (TIGR02145 family)
MKLKIVLFILAMVLILSTYGQRTMFHLTFTANNDGEYVRLDSVKIRNLTTGSKNVIHWPDTSISLEVTPGNRLLYTGFSTGFPVGVDDVNAVKDQFQLFQNYPNPLKDQGIISLYIPGPGSVALQVTDAQGRLVITSSRQLGKGSHSFAFTPGGGNLFFLRASWNGLSRIIKIMSSGNDHGGKCMLNYQGAVHRDFTLKAQAIPAERTSQESGILDAPVSDEAYYFQFAKNIPCPGMPTVSYGGQVYNTIQVYSQCWLKENLNIGTMIQGSAEMANNGILEKYCYENSPDSCTKYGGLYQWDEMMQYSLQPGIKGICPTGWHLPVDEEWQVLEGAADSQFGIGDPVWDDWDFRGADAGLNLKTTGGWIEGGNGTNLFGFTAQPAGDRANSGDFYLVGMYGLWWTSTEANVTVGRDRRINAFNPTIDRNNFLKVAGLSVCCLRNE